LIRIDRFSEENIDFLLQHLDQYWGYTHNILYPTPKETNSLPGSITHANRRAYPKTIKSRTFKFMMEYREALCIHMLGFDLRNEDSSKGLLTPTPFEEMFSNV